MKENKKKRGVKKANTGKAAKRAHAPAKVNKTVPKKAVEKPNVSKLGTYLTYGILALIIIGTFFYIINIAYKQALVGRAYQFVLEDTTVIPGQPLSVDLVSGQPESINLNVQGPAEKALMDVSGTGEDIEISVGAEGVYSSLGNMEDEKLVIREFDNITEEIVELPKAVTITVPRNAIISKAEINTELASLGPITGSIILITGRQVENETQYCNDCASRTSGSEYRCNSNGAFDSNGVYICTCTSNYATACTYNGNNVCDEEETSQCETRDCGSLEQKNNCINQCIYKVCGWDFTYACDAGKNIGSDYLCSCYSGENCRATQCGNGICESSTGEAYASETAENCPQDCTNRICSKACLFRSPGSGWHCNSDGSFNSSGYWCECIDKCEFRTDAPNQTQTQQCSDSTLYNQCSLAKPKYCYNGNLIDKCSVCGCESGFNCENEACVLPPPAPANQTNETPSVAGGGGGGQNITTNVTINGTQPATGGGGELVNITINQTNATTGGGGETANVTINQTTSGGGGGGEITTNITQTNKTISVPEVNVTPAPVPENRTETLAIYLNNNPISTGTINLKDYIKTDCGGEYCTTVLEFASNLPASLKLSSLAIEYSLPVKDFSAEINSYCSEYPCSVPVEIKSKSDGKVTLSNFDISIASPTKPETGTAKRFTVKPYLVYPADKEMYPEYETAVKEYLTELQEWYASNVGATFEMDELKVVRSSYDYLTMRCGSNPSKECIGNPAKLDGNWGYYINTAIHNGTEKWETETAALIFSAGGGGFAGANLYPDHTGFAITGDWVLEPISGTANKWGIPCNYSDGWQCSGGVPKGSPAHELGHAFGLGHPAQENSSKSIMGWHGNYPNVSFLPYEIEYLKKSPFFKETEIRKNITCKDSDGGEVYDMKGITKGIYGSPGGIIYNGKKYEEGDYVELEDYCYDNIKINEFLCFKKSDGGLYVTQGGINCPNGCSDGACVKAPTNETQPWPHPYNFVADSNAIKTDDYFLISNKGFSPRVLRLTGIKKSSTENSIKVWNADGTGTNKWLITAGWVNSTGGSGGSGEMVYDGNTYKFNVYFDEDGADSYISIPDLKWWSEKHKFAVKGKSISVNDYFLISKYGTNPHILELSRIKNATTEKSINVKEIGKETNTWTITETFDIPKPGGKGEMVYDGIRYAFTVDFGSSETDADDKIDVELKNETETKSCSDGTPSGECSAERKFCDSGNLFENCNRCGCAEGTRCNAGSGVCSAPMADLSVGISVSDTAVNKESTATVWIDNLGEADAGNTEIILYDAYEMNNFTAGFGESMAVEVPFKFKFTPYISEDSILIEASFDNMTGQFVLKRGMVAEIKSGFLFMLSEVNEDGIKAKAAKVIVTKNPLGKIPGKVSMQKGISFTPIAVGEHGIFAFLNTSTADSDWQNNYEGWKIKVKGEGPDISVNIPWTTLTVNKTNEIKAEIYDVGTEPAMNISVKLYERKWAGKGYDEKLIGETVIDKISPPASILLFSYKPEEIGYVNLILTAEPIKDVDMDNNRDELPVDVVYDAPNVGIILNSPAPEELKVNIPINISVNIANYGAKEAKDVKLYLYESERGKGEENLISKVTINEILPKGYDWAAFEWTPKTKGKRILRAVVNSTEDADLGNNEDKIYVTVGTEKADIAVSFSEFEEETEINSTSYIVIALENLGSEKARDIAISAYDGPSRIWNDSLKEAAPQKTYYLGFTWTPETKGKHSLKLAADSPDDSDNSNNRDEATINVYGMVDALFNITDSEGANAVRDLIVNGPNFPFVGTLTSPTIVKVPETASEIFLVGWLSISDAAAIRFTEAVPSEDMRAVSELIENKSEDGFLIHYIYANKLNWAYNSSEFGFLKFVSEEINPKGFKILTCPEFNFKEKSCSKEWQEIEKKSIDHNDNYLSITAEVGKNQVVALAEKDSDEDGIPDSKDSDDDNDGISDEKDRVRGKGKDVKGNVKKLNVSIGGEGDAGSTNGTKKVEILEEKKRIVEFEFDFDADELDLTKISIEKQPIADRGSLYVRGISAGNKTKTLYIDKFTKSNKVCIKDAEISSISAISSSCSGDNETLAACDGSDIKGYKCEVIGSTYKISGLSNSGVVEMPEQATPAPATPSPAPSGGGSGGSGGGGGSAPIAGGTKESFMAMNMPSGTTTKTLTTEAIAVQQVSITTKKPAANVDLSVEKLSAKPFTAPEIKGKVYQYVQIAKVNLQDSDISSVKIKFKVEKSWLGAANIKEDGIVLMRLTDKWSELKTAKTSSDAVYVYYEAESPGLSYFAVAQAAEFRALAKPATETPAPAAPAISVPPIEADNMEKAKELRATRTQSRIKFSWIIPTILVSILVLAGIGALIYKKYKAPMKEYSSNKPKTEVEEYVENTLNAGYSEEQVRAALENSGWSEEEINSAFRRLGK